MKINELSSVIPNILSKSLKLLGFLNFIGDLRKIEYEHLNLLQLFLCAIDFDGLFDMFVDKREQVMCGHLYAPQQQCLLRCRVLDVCPRALPFHRLDKIGL